MNKVVTDLTFEEWVALIFDHPAEGPEWYWAPEAAYWAGPAGLTAEYVRLFEDPCPALLGFSEAQLNAANAEIVPELLAYARSARCGCAL